MLIVAGLGNPGRQYAGHRHNVGFMAADAIHRRHSFSPWSKKFNALVAEGRLGGEKVLLVKPQTYMNLSGQAVGEAMRFYKLAPENLIVLYDEIDLAPGKLRIKRGGGHGGHNGIKSIDAHCGKDYRRVRIGIGHPGDKARVNAHVLGDFAKADHEWLEPLLEAVGDGMEMLVRGDESGFMNKVSLAVQGNNGKAAAKPEATDESRSRHARQPEAPAQPGEATGPMAILRKLLGKE